MYRQRYTEKERWWDAGGCISEWSDRGRTFHAHTASHARPATHDTDTKHGTRRFVSVMQIFTSPYLDLHLLVHQSVCRLLAKVCPSLYFNIPQDPILSPWPCVLRRLVKQLVNSPGSIPAMKRRLFSRRCQWLHRLEASQSCRSCAIIFVTKPIDFLFCNAIATISTLKVSMSPVQP